MKTAIIPAHHPVFEGHFPGHPIVPGALLLDRAQAAVEASSGRSVTGLAAAKFLSPVQPDEVFMIEHEVGNGSAAFRIRCGDRMVANGRFRLAPESS